MLELNKIYCMDCLEGMKQLEDSSVDLVLTDPPYNTGIKPKTNNTWLHNFFKDDYSKEEYFNLAFRCCSEFKRLLKPNGGGYIFINWKSLHIWIKCLESNDFKVKNVIVWDKQVHGLNYQNYAYTYEMIIFFINGGFFPENKHIEDQRHGYYKDIWHIKREMGKEDNIDSHETVKPIKLIRLPIIHGSKGEDVVLDPFIGSGTTAIACKQLNRKFIGFEISQKYCDIANERLRQANLKSWF